MSQTCKGMMTKKKVERLKVLTDKSRLLYSLEWLVTFLRGNNIRAEVDEGKDVYEDM